MIRLYIQKTHEHKESKYTKVFFYTHWHAFIVIHTHTAHTMCAPSEKSAARAKKITMFAYTIPKSYSIWYSAVRTHCVDDFGSRSKCVCVSYTVDFVCACAYACVYMSFLRLLFHSLHDNFQCHIWFRFLLNVRDREPIYCKTKKGETNN